MKKKFAGPGKALDPNAVGEARLAKRARTEEPGCDCQPQPASNDAPPETPAPAAPAAKAPAEPGKEAQAGKEHKRKRNQEKAQASLQRLLKLEALDDCRPRLAMAKGFQWETFTQLWLVMNYL